MKQMMRLSALAIILVAMLPAALRAQDFTDKDTLRYVDAMHYRMINWAFDRTLESRIPLNFKDSVRPTLWDRAYCTSGKGFRFATNSTAIAVRYNLLTNMHMMHMADTGIKGTDLYIWDEDTRSWQFVNCNRPVRIDTPCSCSPCSTHPVWARSLSSTARASCRAAAPAVPAWWAPASSSATWTWSA